MSDTLYTIQRIISEELKIDMERITEDAHVFDDLNFDSLDSVELVLALETEFDIEISDDVIDNLTTIGQIHTLIKDLI